MQYRGTFTVIAMTSLFGWSGAIAGTWRCTDSGDGHVYTASQNVPSDRCQQISDVNPYGAGANWEAPQPRPSKRTRRPATVRGGVSIGMSSDDVLQSSWGRPVDINKTTTKYGTREQWVYGGRNYLYFENGILTAIQN